MGWCPCFFHVLCYGLCPLSETCYTHYDDDLWLDLLLLLTLLCFLSDLYTFLRLYYYYFGSLPFYGDPFLSVIYAFDFMSPGLYGDCMRLSRTHFLHVYVVDVCVCLC